MKTIYTMYNKRGECTLTDAVRFRPCTVIIGDHCASAGHRGNRVHPYYMPHDPDYDKWDDVFDDCVRYAFSEKRPTWRLWADEWGHHI